MKKKQKNQQTNTDCGKEWKTTDCVPVFCKETIKVMYRYYWSFCCNQSWCLRSFAFAGSPSRDGDVVVYVKDIKTPTELADSISFCSRVDFCLSGPFNRISFHKFSEQLSAFSLCSSGLISALLVLSNICLFMKVSLSPDRIPSGWLGSKHLLTN